MSMAPCIYWINIYITKEPGLPPGPCYVSTCARGFEPPTFWSVAKRSIQLSYAHIHVQIEKKYSLRNAEYLITEDTFSQ